MRKKHQVLVIDDEKDFCELMKKTLTLEGYSVSVALDGEEGLKIVNENKPDLVLLDLKMPGMDGIEVLEQIKKIDKNIVVIIITGYGTLDTARMSTKFGAFDYITKPVNIEYINTIIKDGLKLALHYRSDQRKEKEISKIFRLKKAELFNVKHCNNSHACLWEIALRAFVLGDESLMVDWITNPEISEEEKLDLTKIAEVLRGDKKKNLKII